MCAHLQVIPFLVLAVGVDNMFILAHALQQQDPRLPIPERLGRALAGAGPSITLAAACEALAFGLGGLTSMPAVRNFSLCAAVTVLLDYALQVVTVTAPLYCCLYAVTVTAPLSCCLHAPSAPLPMTCCVVSFTSTCAPVTHVGFGLNA